MPRAKKTKPLRRTAIITVTCEDDAAERAKVNMTMTMDPPCEKAESSLVVETVVSMMMAAKAEANDFHVKAVKE